MAARLNIGYPTPGSRQTRVENANPLQHENAGIGTWTNWRWSLRQFRVQAPLPVPENKSDRYRGV